MLIGTALSQDSSFIQKNVKVSKKTLRTGVQQRNTQTLYILLHIFLLLLNVLDKKETIASQVRKNENTQRYDDNHGSLGMTTIMGVWE